MLPHYRPKSERLRWGKEITHLSRSIPPLQCDWSHLPHAFFPQAEQANSGDCGGWAWLAATCSGSLSATDFGVGLIALHSEP